MKHGGPLSTTYHHATSFLSSPAASLKLALIVLNVDCGSRELQQAMWPRFEHLWRRSSLRLCADGAANRLHDNLHENERGVMLPDIIAGDLDSLRGDVAGYYAARGVTIQGETDQNTHDFEKCLRWLQQRQACETKVPVATPTGASAGVPISEGGGGDGALMASGAASSGGSSSSSSGGVGGSSSSSAPSTTAYSVVAYGAFGGRLDQQMANLNMAYSYDCFRHFYLVSDHSLAFLLRPGTHVIEPDREAEDGTCGLIPLGGRCEGVSTTGCAHVFRVRVRRVPLLRASAPSVSGASRPEAVRVAPHAQLSRDCVAPRTLAG